MRRFLWPPVSHACKVSHEARSLRRTSRSCIYSIEERSPFIPGFLSSAPYGAGTQRVPTTYMGDFTEANDTIFVVVDPTRIPSDQRESYGLNPSGSAALMGFYRVNSSAVDYLDLTRPGPTTSPTIELGRVGGLHPGQNISFPNPVWNTIFLDTRCLILQGISAMAIINGTLYVVNATIPSADPAVIAWDGVPNDMHLVMEEDVCRRFP